MLGLRALPSDCSLALVKRPTIRQGRLLGLCTFVYDGGISAGKKYIYFLFSAQCSVKFILKLHSSSDYLDDLYLIQLVSMLKC